MEQVRLRLQETLREREWLTPKQTSERYGFAVSTLARYRCEGVGPIFAKISSTKVLYAIEDVEDWLASKRVRSTVRVGAG